jgi:hypothetical protein
MHKVSGTYWAPGPELVAQNKQDFSRLSPHPLPDPLVQVNMLCCDLAGGLPLVAQQFTKDSTFTPPYITVVAAPALATLGSFSATDPPGFAYSDFWDDSILSPYAFDVDDNNHCPMLVATEGFFLSGQASFYCGFYY